MKKYEKKNKIDDKRKSIKEFNETIKFKNNFSEDNEMNRMNHINNNNNYKNSNIIMKKNN